MKMKKGYANTKTQLVLEHLQNKGYITTYEAFKLYDATRLSAIIFNLKKQGYYIKTVMVRDTDRYGRPVTYAKYELME